MDVLDSSPDVFALVDSLKGVQHEVVASAVLDEHQIGIHPIDTVHDVFKLALTQVGGDHDVWWGRAR